LAKTTINIITLGCSKNKVDSEHLAALFPSNYYLVRHDSEKKSDIVIINTCGFIGDAKEESVDTILSFAEAKQIGELKKLYVMGCLSERYGDYLKKEIPEVDAYFGANAIETIAQHIVKQSEIQFDQSKRKLSTPKHYAYLKISEGCDHKCAFCAIPLIRGKQQSVSIEALVNEARILSKRGVKELILIAQDLTYYGVDLYGKRAITQLVEALSEIKEIEWIRLQYAYPNTFPDDLLQLMRTNAKVCKYIDLPLQHINSVILKAMKRGIDRQQTINFVRKVRKTVPEIAFRTTFIVGFPGETEEVFEELCRFVRDMRFERVGVFAYSPEEGTAAFDLEDVIPDEVKQERVAVLMEIQQQIALEINESRVGTIEKVLIDRVEGDFYVGRTQFDSPEVDNEILIPIENSRLVIGQFVDARIVKADFFDCEARLLS
jgi:ribosomal protein S12 methylthiotransferase